MSRTFFDTGPRVTVSEGASKPGEHALILKVGEEEVDLTTKTAQLVIEALQQALRSLQKQDPL